MDTTTRFNAAAWLVDRHVEEGDGARRAFVCGDDQVTYADLQRLTWRSAAMLLACGVTAGERVLMVVADELAFPAVLLGAMRIGAVPVPVSTMLRAEDLAALAADAEAVAVVVSERYAGHLPVIRAAAPTVRVGVQTSGTAEPPRPGEVPTQVWSSFGEASDVAPAPTTAGSVGLWLYTSGTTGKPKGAIHRHGDLPAIAAGYGRSVLGIGPDDVCYSVPKLFFAFGLGNALVFPLAVGACAVLDPEAPTPARVAALAAAHRPTLFFAPPGFCAAMADSDIPGDALASARATVTAGETLPAEVARRFTARFGTEMLDGIGSTEALHIFCSNHPGDVRPGSTGRPVEGYELKLLDDTGAEIASPDTPGSLWVRGPSVAVGYWKRPEVDGDTFVDGWCRTGDVYLRRPDGTYDFVGRNNDMIKAGGIWVSPTEVEAALLEHPDVLEAAVVGARTSEGLETTVAFVVAGRGRVIDPLALDQHCRERMAAFKRPRRIHVVDALPRTPTGKVQRFALRDDPRLAAGA